MKTSTPLLTLISSVIVLSACSSTPVVTADAPIVYLNSNIGLSLDQYKYSQSQMTCEVDNELIENITLRAAKKNIRVLPVYTYSEVEAADNVLAIDITDLPDSTETNHSGSKTVSPKLGVSAAYIEKDTGNPHALTFDDHCTGKFSHGGSKTNASRQTTGGGAGPGICREMRRCARRISANITDWLVDDIKI